jgi:hypothetical protein
MIRCPQLGGRHTGGRHTLKDFPHYLRADVDAGLNFAGRWRFWCVGFTSKRINAHGRPPPRALATQPYFDSASIKSSSSSSSPTSRKNFSNFRRPSLPSLSSSASASSTVLRSARPAGSQPDRRRASVSMIAALLASATAGRAADYTIDPTHSHILFTIESAYLRGNPWGNDLPGREARRGGSRGARTSGRPGASEARGTGGCLSGCTECWAGDKPKLSSTRTCRRT